MCGRRLGVLGSVDREFLVLVEFVGLPGLQLIVGDLMPLRGLRLIFALGTLS